METAPTTSGTGSATQAPSVAAQGMLVAYSDPPAGDEAAFNAWYDEHAPARLLVPGIQSARRYQAATDEGPRYMACYELESPATLQSPEYRRMRENPPAADREMMPRLPLLDRRVLKLLLGTDTWTADAPFVLSVSYEPSADTSIEDVIDWYRDEHIPMLLAIDGWRRARLYERIDGDGPRIVALHELESPNVFETDGYRKATSTPWRDRITGRATNLERHLFRFLKSFASP